MIKIVNYGNPLFTAADNSYQQPTTTGAVQWNGGTKQFQVSNGHSWFAIDNQVTITTDNQVALALEWVKKKMSEEQELERMALSNPALKDLLTQRGEIDQKIKMVSTLIKS